MSMKCVKCGAEADGVRKLTRVSKANEDTVYFCSSSCMDRFMFRPWYDAEDDLKIRSWLADGQQVEKKCGKCGRMFRGNPVRTDCTICRGKKPNPLEVSDE